MPADVESMMYVREVPWHGLGTRVEEAPDSEQALVLAGLDWAVEQKRLQVAGGSTVKDYVANVRASDESVLGIVTKKYKVIQNREAFAWTDQLIGEGAQYETAGALKDGRRIWMLARLPEEVQIGGDEIHPYLLFSNSHDGSSSMRVAITPIRVVCQNTLNVALRGAHRAWSARHSTNIHTRMEEAARALSLARNYFSTLNDLANVMLDRPLPGSDWNELVQKLIPIDDELGDRAKQTLSERQTALRNMINAPDIEPHKGTAWGALNAVVDFADHEQPKRKLEGWEERRFAKVVDGHPLVDHAAKLLA